MQGKLAELKYYDSALSYYVTMIQEANLVQISPICVQILHCTFSMLQLDYVKAVHEEVDIMFVFTYPGRGLAVNFRKKCGEIR